MALTDWVFDGVLGLLVVVLAVAVLYARTLYASIVLFIAFGLLLAVVWARLGAADLALAEAAIGAGLTGALLLAALAQTSTTPFAEQRSAHWTRQRWPATGLALLVGVLLVRSLVGLDRMAEPGLMDAVTQNMADAGVGHPVTAVLLNFRAWDTLLELVVLLLALLGVRQLATKPLVIAAPWALLEAWSRILAPLAVLVGGYLLWRGSNYPGGAFQSGALLAAAAVVLRLNHLLPPVRWSSWGVRILVLLGVAVFLTVAIFTHWLGAGWLNYPLPFNGLLILLIEIAATVSIATTLTLLVVGEPDEVRA
ncbi:Na(+)/H(+) antiporter subunit B [Salinispirillum sp. LH 10-3-1]|uniref:Na(+)/H(+) antiporter subunit B n=1 Tax=Salinispirillum sp. LH 10-3-1 TaxID=2952525 RepID=A0AB38YF05_9GAMM